MRKPLKLVARERRERRRRAASRALALVALLVTAVAGVQRIDTQAVLVAAADLPVRTLALLTPSEAVADIGGLPSNVAPAEGPVRVEAVDALAATPSELASNS